MSGAGGDSGRGVIADRLNALFAASPNPQRHREWTLKEVAQGIQDRGFEVSPSYIWRLKAGIARNPTLHHLEGLAQFFNVPVAYFVDDRVAEQVRGEMRALAVLREIGASEVVARGGGSDSTGPDVELDEVRAFLEDIRRRRGSTASPRDQSGGRSPNADHEPRGARDGEDQRPSAP